MAILPSATGGGLSRGAEGFLKAYTTRRELQQRDRQLGQFDRQLGQGDVRLEQSGQANALDALMKIRPFLPRDVPLNQMGGMGETVSAAIPFIDINDPVMGSMTLNRESAEQALDEAMHDMVLNAPDTPEGNAALDRHFNLMTSGTGTTGEVLAAGEQVQLMDSEVWLNSYEELKKPENAHLWTAVARGRFGLDPFEYTFTDPLTGKDWTFDTAVGASLTEDLMKHWSMVDLEWGQISAKDKLDLAGELMGQMESFEKEIGRPTAIGIISAWEKQNQGEQQGVEGFSAAEQTGPWYDLWDDYVGSGQDSAIKAMQVWGGAAHFGEVTAEDLIFDTPVGRQAMVFTTLGKQVSDAFPGASAQQRLKFTRQMVEKLPEFGFDMSQIPRALPGQPFALQFRNAPNNRFRNQTRSMDSQGDEGSISMLRGMSQSDATSTELMPMGIQTPAQPQMTPEQIEAQQASDLMNTISAYSLGNMTLQQMKEKYPNPLVQQYIVQQAGGGGR